MKQKLLKLRKKISASLAIAALTVMAIMPTAVFASSTPTPAAGIDINFEPSQMFTYSNVIISCLMPVVYITAGLSLGFTIIYALKSAFSGRV